MWPFSDNSWKTVAAEKQAQREKLISAITATGKVEVSAEHNEILRSTASDIVAAIEQKKWTAKQVVSAFIARAAVAQKVTNCYTEILFESALQEAEELDRQFSKTQSLKGPLHGVPITFKDQFEIAGYDATIGFTRWANKPATEDADVVKQIRAAGGIIIAKTNVPQTMLSFECSNPLWGKTLNPWSKDHTSGGSSGGEAASLACDASVIGIGSDIGGSLRIPTHYCGIYSLKPTVRRISTVGTKSPTPGYLNIVATLGPMARSVADLKLTSKLLFGASSPHTPQALPPVPYRDHKLPSKLRFGYYFSEGIVKASPASQRAVLETVAALRSQGHECVQFDIPDGPRALGLFAGLSSADGYKTLTSHLGPDPKEKSLFLVTLGPKLPSLVRWLALKLLGIVKNDTIFAQGLQNSRVRSTDEEWALVNQKNEYVKQFYKEVWDKHSFDGIITPVQAGPAMPHGATATLSPLACPTFLYNIVDSPIGILPVTRVDPSRDALDDEWIKGPGHGSVLLEQDYYLKSQPVYDATKMAGLPIAVQVIGRAWEDEKVLEMLDVVDRALGPRNFGPGTWNTEA